jgi:Glycosyl transferase family 90
LAGRRSTAAERLADFVNSRVVAKDLERTLQSAGYPARVTVALDGDSWPMDVSLKRVGDGFRVTYSSAARQRFVLAVRHFLRAYVVWMAGTPETVRRMTVNGSDGDLPSQARFAPSARSDAQTAIPDPHFWRFRGFEGQRSVGKTAPGWSGRSDAIVWRGDSNGVGRLSLDPRDEDDPSVIPRLRMCMKLGLRAGHDIKLINMGSDSGVWRAPAKQLGLAGDPVDAQTWLERKYAIDIDGQTNTWSNFFVRMLFGCCVFKVDSQLGFRQWYYDRLKPFEHYVPVRADMSDFLDKIEWARGHQAEAREIAAAGQRFAMALDFEAGKREAVGIITANWDKRGL